MTSMPSYREFVPLAALGGRSPRPAPARRGFFRLIADAIALAHQQAAEREIARRLGSPPGKLNDEIERRLFEHLAGNRGFRP